MKPFNLEEAKKGKPICTRKGDKARIICTDFKSPDHQIIAAVWNDIEEMEEAILYTDKGEYIIGQIQIRDLDLMMAEEEPQHCADEKIRKNFITFFKEEYGTNSSAYFAGIKVKEIIAWLEKQGEQKSAKWSEADEQHIDSLLKRLDGLCRNEFERTRFAVNEDSDWLKSLKKRNKIEHFFNEFEKQGAKFHKGDWVVLTAGELSTTLQIVNVDTNKKVYWFNDSSYLYFVDEDCLHLWTIEDAEDGDVLVVPSIKGSEHSEQIFIFKEIKDRLHVKNAVEYYCRYMDNEFTVNKTGYMGTASERFYPATIEQYDILFKAMADAGYEFDFDKKELKKIKD